jgi:hypothetical protein
MNDSLPSHLRADCGACCGLCCVALPFEAFQGFGFDKPAHAACRHLDAAHRCSIHGALAARGFRGCSAYDCLGAGQRVTVQLFKGAAWSDSPRTGARMFEAFRKVRALHELMALVQTALSHVHEPALSNRLAELDRCCEAWETADLAAQRRQTLELLRQLADSPAVRALKRA